MDTINEKLLVDLEIDDKINSNCAKFNNLDSLLDNHRCHKSACVSTSQI